MMDTEKVWQFDGFWHKSQWTSPAFVTTNANGIITQIGGNPGGKQVDERVNGYAFPGWQNAHSHAFQYAMAGLGEIHAPGLQSGDFWSWRNTMYKLALNVQPEQMEAIAAMLYAEMLRHGYTHVAEFHYLHHNVDGKPFAQTTLMSEHLCRAAQSAGIHLTLIPIFYQKGGFGKEPTAGQRRFIHQSPDDYLAFLAEAQQLAERYGQKCVPGFHSLRAVDAMSLKAVVDQIPAEQPIHIHIAEQLKEVDDCLAFYGKRPVEWLHDEMGINNRWHLVHATHITQSELEKIVSSGANVVLCPSTEGNLGDGIFPLREFYRQGGKWSIGTDSHVGIDPKEELRLLDYGQRLVSHQRNPFVLENSGHSAKNALETALNCGSAAMGDIVAGLEMGKSLDAVVLNTDHPALYVTHEEQLLSKWLYAGDATANAGTICKGQWVVKNQQHEKQESLRKDYFATLKNLYQRL